MKISETDVFQTLPNGIFLQQQFDKLSRNMKGECTLRHLLQDPEVVAVRGGEPVRSRHYAPKHWSRPKHTITMARLVTCLLNSHSVIQAADISFIETHSPAFSSGSLHRDEDLDLMPMDSVRLSSTARTIWHKHTRKNHSNVYLMESIWPSCF